MSSPFAAASLLAEAPAAPAGETADHFVTTPFAEALASYDESELGAEAAAVLRAEFEDEEFQAALDALAGETAARHLTATGTWASEAEGHRLADSEAEQWMETVAARADHLLAELEAHFGDRPAQAGTEAEIEAVAGLLPPGMGGPVDAQEQFLSALVNKVKKVASGVGKLVKKGIGAVSKLLPLGKLFGVLRKLVRPLLQQVLRRAIGRLPAPLRPVAQKIAARFGAGAPASPAAPAGPAAPAAADAADAGAADPAAATPTGADPAAESPWNTESLAADFDARLTEAVLATNEAAMESVLAEYEAPAHDGEGPLAELDGARLRLARQLMEAEPGRPPIAEMEQFIPVVMAAMKLVKLGVRIIGRKKVVDFIAKLLAALVKDMVGEQAAKQLSVHVADAGLRLLGLEAERPSDGTLGAEALVAATEDTIREVLALPAESLENELLLEAATEEAFAAAAVRHFPAGVLRPDIVAARAEGERGIWVLFPRAARPHYRYKKYSFVQPFRIARPLARSVVFADGETLEDRLLEAGVRTWPVEAEAHVYELLPGAEIGHLAAFELAGEGVPYAEAALEFEELAPGLRLPVSPGPRHGTAARRVVRIRVPGARLHRRSPFGLRLDLAGDRPELTVHVRLSERAAHLVAGHLQRNEHAQVVALVRRIVGGPARPALAARLRRLAARHGLPPALAGGLADRLAEAIARAVAEKLPAAAAELATAAKDPAPGVTLTFAFPAEDKAALGRGELGEPTVRITPGAHRG